jgi:hypothetical protein
MNKRIAAMLSNQQTLFRLSRNCSLLMYLGQTNFTQRE